MVHAVSWLSTLAPFSFPLSGAGWVVLKALLQVREGLVMQLDHDILDYQASRQTAGGQALGSPEDSWWVYVLSFCICRVIRLVLRSEVWMWWASRRIFSRWTLCCLLDFTFGVPPSFLCRTCSALLFRYTCTSFEISCSSCLLASSATILAANWEGLVAGMFVCVLEHLLDCVFVCLLVTVYFRGLTDHGLICFWIACVSVNNANM